MRRRAIITTLFAIIATIASPQNRDTSFGVVYYDVDRLYDTTPSKSYNDRDFTPRGRLHWNEQRYHRKIEKITQVVDSMAQPVVVLFGVENEQVVRDLVSKSTNDYAYIHRDQNISHGLEFALLYQADSFRPTMVTPSDRALCIEGEACGGNITLIAAYKSSSLRVSLRALRNSDKANNIILIGALNGHNIRHHLPHPSTLHTGYTEWENHLNRGKWRARDMITTNIASEHIYGVYIKQWVLDDYSHTQTTFERRKHIDGGSRHLPIYIYFRDLFAY